MAFWDLTIFNKQQNVVYADDVDQALRFIKWLRLLGYSCSGPSEEMTHDGIKYKVYTLITRATIASTTRGDAVTFTGEYQVAEEGQVLATVVSADVPNWVLTGIGEPSD